MQRTASESIGRCPNGPGRRRSSRRLADAPRRRRARPTPAWRTSTRSRSPSRAGAAASSRSRCSTRRRVHELYNLISLLCSSPRAPVRSSGSRSARARAIRSQRSSSRSEPTRSTSWPTVGAYSISFPTSRCPGLALSVEGAEHPGAPRVLQHPGRHADDDLRHRLHLIRAPRRPRAQLGAPGPVHLSEGASLERRLQPASVIAAELLIGAGPRRRLHRSSGPCREPRRHRQTIRAREMAVTLVRDFRRSRSRATRRRT